MRRRLVTVVTASTAAALVAAALIGTPAAPARAGAAEINKAMRDAKSAIESDDPKALEAALAVVVREGGRVAGQKLINLMKAFPSSGGRLYWQVVGAAASLTDADGLDVVGDYLVSNGKTSQARDLLFSMQSNRSEATLGIYTKLLKRSRVDDMRLMAVDRLGELARPEAVDALMEAWEKEDGTGSPLERRIKTTVVGLFGEDMGGYVNFSGYWQQNRDTAIGKHAGGGTTTGTVKDELDAARRGSLASVSRGSGKVLVLEGNVENFDKIQDMLTKLGVPNELMQKTKFMEDMDKALDGVCAVVLNCNFFADVCHCPTCVPGVNPASRLPMCTQCDKHDLKNDGLTDEAVARIKRFVEEGGSLFTEDWGLRELTAKAWPTLVKDGTDLTGQEVVYAPVPGQTANPLLRGVLARPGGGGEGAGTTVTAFSDVENKWKIDNLSPSIQVLDARGVTVLLESPDLAKASGGNGAVAITFSPPRTGGGKKERRPTTGGGRRGRDFEAPAGVVLHVLSHFGKQGNKEDEFTLQNLLINFVLEASERYQLSKR